MKNIKVPDTRGEASPGLITALSVLALIVLVGGAFALRVALAPAVGKGGAVIQQQAAANRIAQNSVFFNLRTDFDATVSKLPVFAAAAKSGDRAAVTTLTGLRSHCLDVAGQYAAASGAYISKDFKDAGLPASLDPTVCQEQK